MNAQRTNIYNAPLNNGACQAYCMHLTDLKPMNCDGCGACTTTERRKIVVCFEE
jgi:hypothetical protein